MPDIEDIAQTPDAVRVRFPNGRACWLPTEAAKYIADLQAKVDAIPTRVTKWAEGTADPIYLLQARRYVCKEGDRYTFGEDGQILDEAGAEVDAAYMADVSEDWEEVWETERVFFTREEADAYGNGRAYNYPEGWRSYSVPAMGELRDLVRMLTTRAPDPREPRP